MPAGRVWSPELVTRVQVPDGSARRHEGKFDEAKKAYEKALQLDPKNLMIRQNYDLFKEINDRTKRRSGK